MAETVYLLWFVQEREEAADTELLIGVFALEADAERVVDKLKLRPGFAAYNEGFQIHAHEIGQISWTEGFVEEPVTTVS